MQKTRLPWRWATTAIAAMLFLLLILSVCLDGAFSSLSKGTFWLTQLIGLILIIYILVIYPFAWRLRERALQAYFSLLSMDYEIFNELANKIRTPNRTLEWLIVLMGIVMTCLMGQPWNLGWSHGELWLSVYMVIVSPIFNCLLFWFIFDTLNGVIRIVQFSRYPLELDILETDLLTPVAQYSLGISIVFIGGTSLSLLNETWESLLKWNNIITYSILIVAILMMFFLTLWGTHNAISRIKNRELSIARKHLTEASRELKKQASIGKLEGVEELSSTISLWATYQGLVKDIPTWPFNADTIRKLLASTVVPIAVYVIKIVASLGIRF